MKKYILKQLREAFNPYQRQLDAILDKINQVGYDGLTPQEHKRLDIISQGGNLEDPEAWGGETPKDRFDLPFPEFAQNFKDAFYDEFSVDDWDLSIYYSEGFIQVYTTQGITKYVGRITYEDDYVCFKSADENEKFCRDAHLFTHKFIEKLSGRL